MIKKMKKRDIQTTEGIYIADKVKNPKKLQADFEKLIKDCHDSDQYKKIFSHELTSQKIILEKHI